MKLKINPKHNGVLIGAVFTVISLLLSQTYFPLLFIGYIGGLMESFISPFVEHPGKGALVILLILFLISMGIVLVKSKKHKYYGAQIIGIMILAFFIIHPLWFYVDWAITLNFRSDGQLIFGVFDSFLVSSFAFIALGLLIDRLNIKKSSQQN